MKISAHELASLVKGQAKGNMAVVIEGAAGLEEATSSDISFLKEYRANTSEKFIESKAGLILVPCGTPDFGKTVIEVEHPLAAFSLVLSLFEKEKRSYSPGIHPSSVIDPKASVGKNVYIGPHCVVSAGAEISDNVVLVAQVFIGERSTIGEGSLIYPHVAIREDVVIGQRCILHAGCVIGSDGYGFYFAQGRHNKIPQIGSVVVGDDVEIGSCTTIDRATTGQTIIRSGAKIDNLVQIAHNVDVGHHALLVAQVGIAGSSKIGNGVVLAGQVGVADHVVIGDGAQVGAQSGIKENIAAGSVMFGSPAQPLQETLKQTLLIRKLAGLFKDVKELKEKLSRHE